MLSKQLFYTKVGMT